MVVVAMVCGALVACTQTTENAATESESVSADVESTASEESAAVSPEDAAAQSYKIAYILPDLENTYYTSIADGLNDAAAEAGDVEVVVFDGQNDSAKQLNLAEDAISNGVNAVMITPYDTDIGSAVTEVCVEAGVPVYILDTGAEGDYNAFLTADNYGGGYLAGEYMLTLMPKEDLNIAELQGILARLVPAQRGVGFNDALKDAGVQTPVPYVSSANYDRTEGMNLMEDFLTKDNTINAVFCWNDEMALGALEAIKARGLEDQISVIGFDASAEAVQSIIDGDMVASVAQSPYNLGKTAIELFFKDLNGDSYEKDILIPCQLITEDNAEEYLKSIS
jgi:ribose transport system substrate-binding protein